MCQFCGLIIYAHKTFTAPFVHSSIHASFHVFIHRFRYWSIHLLMHSFFLSSFHYQCIHSFIISSIYPFITSSLHWFINISFFLPQQKINIWSHHNMITVVIKIKDLQKNEVYISRFSVWSSSWRLHLIWFSNALNIKQEQ